MYMYKKKRSVPKVADSMTKLNTYRNFQFNVLAITKFV